MKLFRFFIYIISLMILLMLPIYATARILLPEWLKSQISSNLPANSIIQFGEIKTNTLLGMSISSLIFHDRDKSFSIILKDLSFMPNLSFNNPATFSINEIDIISKINKIKFLKLEGSVIFDKDFKKENLIFSGDFESLNSDEKNFVSNVSNINFILKGIFSEEKNLNLRADNMFVDYQSPLGKVNMKGKNVSIDTKIKDIFLGDFEIDNFELDFSNLGSNNSKRFIRGDELIGSIELKKDVNWTMPIKFKTKNLSSPQVSNIELLSVSAKGEWPNGFDNCTWEKLFSDQKACGKMINVKDLILNLEDEGNLLTMEGLGVCVAPESGCPQKINSKIYSKGTSQIFSKIMMTGIINPIIGGILLASLLSSPNVTDINIDHQVKLEVLGSNILINGQKIF